MRYLPHLRSFYFHHGKGQEEEAGAEGEQPGAEAVYRVWKEVDAACSDMRRKMDLWLPANDATQLAATIRQRNRVQPAVGAAGGRGHGKGRGAAKGKKPAEEQPFPQGEWVTVTVMGSETWVI
uniref:Uncharacterized protein n=1 Tax=Chlamydomonas leiostraca TaxID=1034604 RepID=A0A7S0RVW6_9CHLO